MMPTLQSRVFFSARAVAGVEVEGLALGDLETGGVFLGHIVGCDFYVLEHVWPGVRSRHSICAYEYDEEYVRYTAQRVSALYHVTPKLIGLWHRHPGSDNSFSPIDEITHRNYIEKTGDRLLSCIINFDPVLKITPYVIHHDSSSKIIEHVGGDAGIPTLYKTLRCPTPLGSTKWTDNIQQPTDKRPTIRKQEHSSAANVASQSSSEVFFEPIRSQTISVLAVYTPADLFARVQAQMATKSQVNVFGLMHQEPSIVNIISLYPAPGLSRITIRDQLETTEEEQGPVLIWSSHSKDFLGSRIGNEAIPVNKKLYEQSDLFFRTGLQKYPIKKSKVLISGCGSVGSFIALELARAGFAEFVLVDPDNIQPENICRHQCGIRDIGLQKVEAVHLCIMNINPEARVSRFSAIIEDLSEAEARASFEGLTLAVGCADNRQGDIYLSTLSKEYNVPMISIGLWEQAAVGEIFYSDPAEPSHKHYHEIFSADNIEFSLSARESRVRRFYSSDATTTKTTIANYADIIFVSTIAVKIILDIICRKAVDYRPRLINDIQQYTLICNTCDKDIAGAQVEIFSYPLQITRSIIV